MHWFLMDISNKLPPVKIERHHHDMVYDFISIQRARWLLLRTECAPDPFLEECHEAALKLFHETGLFTSPEQDKALWRLSRTIGE